MPTNKLLAGIARDHLHIPTLEPRNSDSLDFHTVAVWSIKDALAAAFAAGADSAQNDATTIDVRKLLANRREVAVIWNIEDVQHLRPDLNDDQAWQVLQQCEDVHDCEWGFTWTHIETVAKDMYPKPIATDDE